VRDRIASAEIRRCAQERPRRLHGAIATAPTAPPAPPPVVPPHLQAAS
jgi:hypothetical protein